VLSLPAAAPGGRRYVVIAGLAPTTLEQMAYRVWLRQAPWGSARASDGCAAEFCAGGKLVGAGR
jgi:hypothetical protein